MRRWMRLETERVVKHKSVRFIGRKGRRDSKESKQKSIREWRRQGKAYPMILD